jgi:predicted ATPase/DNA-binding SARP family transcriptional activator
MEFRILGPLELRGDGRVLGLGGEKRRALLAMLLLHPNEPVSAERLAVALWGEDAAAEAIKTVRVHVSRIRATLCDPDVLVTTPAGYRLRVRGGELDADAFEELVARGRRALADEAPAQAAELLRDALGLWRGDVLADLRYEPFAQGAIARLEELRWDAIEARNEADLALGRGEAVLAELDRRADEAPLRERLVEQRMRALYAAGRHVEALGAYRDARQRLDAELGLEPGPALRELERAILGHDGSLHAARTPEGPPSPLTATIGREADLEAVGRVVADRRLITLTGPGGVGKTRVAIEAARALASSFPGGVHVAHLARVAAADEVGGALARAVKVAVLPGERDEDALVRRLGGAKTLLVVDNCEHVLDSGPLLGELVASCARLHVLATSREPLRLRGEQCFPVAPLRPTDAITLFVDRARDRRPDFGLTDANASAVAELCRRLDGLPLAIELAAGRIALLEADEIVARLADALPLLGDGPRDAPARQQTIRATLEWSYGLLDAEEQRVFRALAVFRGGTTISAAEEVAAAPVAVLDALVEKNLARAEDGRITQLEVVRQFAVAALAGTPGAAALRHRHAVHHLVLAERLGPQVRESGHGTAFDALERELGNLRAALDHWISARDADRALRLAAAVEPYWTTSCHYLDGVEMVDAALSVAPAGSARARGRARVARAVLLRQVRMEESIQDSDAALELCCAAGDLEGQCMALDMVAAQASYFGDLERAQALAAEERAIAERLGDPYHLAIAVMRQAWSAADHRECRTFADEAIPMLRRCGNLHGIAEISVVLLGAALREGDYDSAVSIAEEGLRAAEDSGEPFVLGLTVGNTGLAALFAGRMDVAEERWCRAMEIFRREHIEGFMEEAVLGLACIAAQAGDHERAATFDGAYGALPGITQAPGDLEIQDRLRATFISPARAALGEAAWNRAAAAGAEMTPDELCRLAVARRVTAGAPAR